jgi:7-cyano-7-deazaguanine reductase
VTEDYEGLKALRAAGSGAVSYNGPDSGLLEAFDSPFHGQTKNQSGAQATIHIEAPEFTSLCPITGQPDFAVIVIDYKPGKKCVESKSLKLYLMGFRMSGQFHEACVNRITNDLVKLLDPVWLKVEGRFTPRGGISFWPTAEYGKRD